MTEINTQQDLTPPPGFRFDPDLLVDYADQVRAAISEKAYQEEPLPSFEDVPELDIFPVFNPTSAPDSEIFARGRAPRSLSEHMAPRSRWSSSKQPVKMWRIVEKSKVEDGSGLVASSILQKNSLGDVEGFDPVKHLASSHEGRMGDVDKTTPFVSFSTDPEYLAKNLILRHGFGIKGERESVVVQVQVDPDRVITGPEIRNRKSYFLEVLLLTSM